MSPTVYVWKSPVPADGEEAEALLRAEAFEPSDDVRWFSREMTGDAPPVWNPDRPATRLRPFDELTLHVATGSARHIWSRSHSTSPAAA
jgi:hypothetical protein